MNTKSIFFAGLASIIFFYVPVFFLNNDILFALTAEDAFYETLGALLFLFASIIFLFIFLRVKTRNIFFLLFALAFFFAAGEEISWGQRIFNFETPEIIRATNAQQEFNIHNLNPIQHENRFGTSITGLLFNLNRLFILSCMIYCVFIPAANRYSASARNLFSRIRLPIISLWFGVLFVLNETTSKTLEFFILLCRSDDCPKVYEIKESVWGLMVFLWAVYFLFGRVAGYRIDPQVEKEGERLNATS